MINTFTLVKHMPETNLEIFLQLSGLFYWTLAYLLIIRRGKIDKTYGMPIIACCGNLTWELYYGFIEPISPTITYINSVWLLIDFVILYQVFIYTPKLFPNFKKWVLWLLIVLALILAYFIVHLGDLDNITVINNAFADNLMMSALFIGMLIHRASPAGQSIYIALFKFLGTVHIVILIYYARSAFHEEHLVSFVYFATLLLDIIYFILLYSTIKNRGENPWRRI